MYGNHHPEGPHERHRREPAEPKSAPKPQRQIDPEGVDLALKLANEIAELDKKRDPKPLPLVLFAEVTPQMHEGVDGVARSYAVIKGGKVVGTLSRVEPKGKPAVYVAFDNAGKKLKLGPTSKSLAAMRDLAENALTGRRDR